jgi:hypothetical protein
MKQTRTCNIRKIKRIPLLNEKSPRHKAYKESIHSINIFGSYIDEEKILSGLKDIISTYLIKPEYLKKRD